jgi:hypothetical protein
VCYFLYIASPLTLTEVRSMVPEGITVDLADPAEQRALKPLHRGIQTVAKLLIGQCSCDFVHRRGSTRQEDERHLRERYRRTGIPRAGVIAGLDRHRAGASIPPPQEGWPRALVDFVLEHARNAGPTVYLLTFRPPSFTLQFGAPVRRLHADQITPDLEQWLLEGSPVLISR